MTDQPEQPTDQHPVAPSRWERLRPRTRLSKIAAGVVAAAAAVFVAGGIFATGFALGSDGGGHHGHTGTVAEQGSHSKHHRDHNGDQHG